MKSLELSYLQSAEHVHALLRTHGYKPVVSRVVLAAVLHLLQPSPRVDLIREATEFFRSKAAMVPDGLAELPSAWLRDLPALVWSSRKAHWTEIPYMIRRLTHEDGALCMMFAQELPNIEDRLSAWDRLRLRLNLGLQPNLWTPLPRDLERRIWIGRPDLRSELFRLYA